MKHGSLFSGIGGFDLGFERAGIETIWQVEIEDYARRVLARHFPRAQRFNDIRECGKHNLAPVDIISGGFPCQDISNAGKRAGIDGERSGLWSEYARIIRELRPRFVVVENVAALLGRGMERVLGDLAACGYDAEWQSIRASDMGAPHRRERIWIISYPSGFRCARRDGVPQGQQYRGGRQAFRFFDSLHSDVSNSNGARLSVRSIAGENPKDAPDEFAGPGPRQPCTFPHAADYAENGKGIRRSESTELWRIEPNVGRVAHGVSKRVDRLKGLGNAIVPQIAEFIGRRIVEANQ